MTLSERASEFVKAGNPGEQSGLLADCVRANDLDGLVATQRLYEDMYGDITFNFELKAPAAMCLILWREAGINALMEGVRRTPTSKNFSIVVQLLSALAARTTPALLFMDRLEPEIGAAIVELLHNDPALSVLAREKLTEFMLSLPTDDEAASVAGRALQALSFQNDSAAKEVFSALASRWLTVGQATLGQYRQLIADHADDEPQFQRFFEKFPQLLDPMAIMVWPRPDLHGAKEPDFVLKRADGTYLIVEIETPAKNLVTGSAQISADATEALTQATDYRSFLMERFSEAKTHFPDFRDPDCLVIIGLERQLSPEQSRALSRENEHRHRVRIVGFDWIGDRAEKILKNAISANIAIRPLRML